MHVDMNVDMVCLRVCVCVCVYLHCDTPTKPMSLWYPLTFSNKVACLLCLLCVTMSDKLLTKLNTFRSHVNNDRKQQIMNVYSLIGIDTKLYPFIQNVIPFTNAVIMHVNVQMHGSALFNNQCMMMLTEDMGMVNIRRKNLLVMGIKSNR